MKFKVIGFLNNETTLILRHLTTQKVMYWFRETRNTEFRYGQLIPDPRTEVMYDFT